MNTYNIMCSPSLTHACPPNVLNLPGIMCVASYMFKSFLYVVLQIQLHTPMLSTARELDQFGWIMYNALALSPDFMTVLPVQLAHITVATLRMLVLVVKFSVSNVLMIMYQHYMHLDMYYDYV